MLCRIGRCWKNNNSLQTQTGRGCHHHPYNWAIVRTHNIATELHSQHCNSKFDFSVPHDNYHPGFNVETVNYKNLNFTAWDVGGRDKIVRLDFVNTITCAVS